MEREKKSHVIKNEQFERPEMELRLFQLKTSRRKRLWGKEYWVWIKDMKIKVSLYSYSNTCHTSGSEWSGRSSTESSCEDYLNQQTLTLWGTSSLSSTARDLGKQLLPTLCSCKALDPGPGPGEMHSQAHLPFLLYLRYYFCKETLVL